MAGLNIDPSKIAAARSAGYTDQQIVDHLSAQSPDQFSAAAKAGYSPTEVLEHLAPQPADVGSSLQEGIASVPAGIAKTIKENVGAGPVSNWLDKKAQQIAPENYAPANLVDTNGVHPSNLMSWLAARAPGMGVAVSSYKLMPGPWWAKLAAGAGAGALMGAGDLIQEAADKRTGQPNSTPTTADKIKGDLTAAASNAAAALPFGRYATGPIAKVGAAGVANAAKRLGATALEQGAANATGDAISQAGTSVGTPGGVSVDPARVADSALGGAVLGGAFGARPALQHSIDAVTYNKLGNSPEMQQAATQAANRIVSASDGQNLNAGLVFGGKAQRTGAEAFHKADADIKNELGQAISNLRSSTTLSPDAHNILENALSGKQPSPTDYATVTKEVAGDPNGDNVLNLVRQAHAMDIFRDTGHLTPEKFTGGIASHIGSRLTGENVTKTALAGLGATMFEGGAGHIIAYSPEIMSAVAGATALGRLADNITGARSPAGRITNNFADPSVPVRLPPVAPNAPPSFPAKPMPWGPVPPTATPGVTPVPAQPLPITTANSPGNLAETAAKPYLKELAMRAKVMQVRNDRIAREQALREVNASPVIQQTVGGPQNIPPPAGAKVMRAALSGAKTLQAIRDNPMARVAARQAPTASEVLPDMQRQAAVQSLLQKLAGQQKPLTLTGVTKANGKMGTKTNADEYVVPSSPYAHLPPEQAAKNFLNDAIAGGAKIGSKQGFINGTVRNINQIRQRAALVAKEVPSLSAQGVAAQFEGVATQKEAIAHRDWLIKHHPEAAAALNEYFSDTAIKGTKLNAGIWKRKG